MTLNFNITGKQISSIHNSTCDMYILHNVLTEMFKSDSEILKTFDRAFSRLKPVRDELMKLKDEHDDHIREQAKVYAQNHGFRHTTWSIYDIDSLLNTSNVPAGSIIITPYDSNDSVVVEGYKGTVSWLELWKAVEKLASITRCNETGRIGFGNHVFIEKFVPVEGKENTFEVWLGS